MSNMDCGSTDSYFLEILENTAKFDHDLFNIFENLENDPVELIPPLTPLDDQVLKPLSKLVSQKSNNSSSQHDFEAELEATSSHDTPHSHKRAKISVMPSLGEEASQDHGQQRIMHITVERNRRKQMNENLSVLRTLMPCFYVKRGDQASIIGGVVDYIKELEQVLQSLEAKKQRKVYNEVLSPRIVSSPRLSTALSSPRKSPLSPRVNLPISPRTPQPSSPYKPQQQLCAANYNLSPSTSTTTTAVLEPASSSSSSFDHNNMNKELVENSKSSVAEVEVKFLGPNVLLKTVSRRITGQVLKIITAIEALSLEILHLSVNIVDETMVNSFTIKLQERQMGTVNCSELVIGIECQLSVEDLAHEIQQTFY